jgi:hypothetical protein
MKVLAATSVLLLSAVQAFAADTYQILHGIQDLKGSTGSGGATVLDTNTGDIFGCFFEYQTVPPIKITSKLCTKGRPIGDSARFPTGPDVMLAPVATNPLVSIIWKVDAETRNVNACAAIPDAVNGLLCTTISLPQ